ncbi:hypothetical protein BDZ85DRAFT_175623, partial [Elsinoe ampelina]
NLALLTSLHRSHIATIPYENICLHYSSERYASLDADSLLDRIISKQRGGYCMELNMIFHLLLGRLGFQTYMTGARLGQDCGDGEAFSGWRHSIIVVIIPGSGSEPPARYMVDVGFGGDGPVLPIPLIHDTTLPNLGTQEMRLTFGPIERLSSAPPEVQPHLWSYWTRNTKEHAWRRQFCFSLLEFTSEDFKVINHFASTHEESIQTKKLMVVKFLADSNGTSRSVGDCRITGKLILVNETLKINTGGRSKILRVCSTEEERVDVLKDHFDISIDEKERCCIAGSPVEL